MQANQSSQTLSLKFLIAKYRPSAERGITVYSTSPDGKSSIRHVTEDDMRVLGMYLNRQYPHQAHLIIGGVYIGRGTSDALISVSSFDPSFPGIYYAGRLFKMNTYRPANLNDFQYSIFEISPGYIFAITTSTPKKFNTKHVSEISTLVPGRHFKVNTQIRMKLNKSAGSIMLINANDGTIGVLKIKVNKYTDFVSEGKVYSGNQFDLSPEMFLPTSTEISGPNINKVPEFDVTQTNLDEEEFDIDEMEIETKTTVVSEVEEIKYYNLPTNKFKGFFVLPNLSGAINTDSLGLSIPLTKVTTNVLMSRSNFYNAVASPAPGVYTFDVHIKPTLPVQRRPGTLTPIKDVQTAYLSNSFTPKQILYITKEISDLFF